MSEDESKFRKLISYAIIGAVVFASFIAPVVFFILSRFFGWEAPQVVQDWIEFFAFK